MGNSNNKNAVDYKALAERVGEWHLRQRLGVERDHVDQIFGRGRNFFHVENWYSIHVFFRAFLRLTGLYRMGQRNAADMRLHHHDVAVRHLDPALDGFRILHLSDLHVDMRADIVDAMIRRVQEAEYDICVLTGDYRSRTYDGYDETLAGMERLLRHIDKPVYGVLGNHDFIEMVPGLEAMGIRMLLNESTLIEHNSAHLYLAGIDDAHYYCVDNLEKAASHIPPEEAAVLLSHSPEIYRQAAHAGFDLMLCGHTHGGQVCLPGGIAPLYNADAPRRMCRGAWDYHRMRGYTSVGCGSCVVDVRFNCPPEVVVHRLHRAGDEEA
jgi:hypothetical protein